MTKKKLKIFGQKQRVDKPILVEKFLDIILKNTPKDHKEHEKMKRKFASKTHDKETIQNRDLIAVAKKKFGEVPEKLQKLLLKRAVRTVSGVSPIGILTKAYACPGRCVYCPTEDRMPKSYMSNQPAAARALRNNFHPYRQVANRVTALEDSGHPVSKLEVIVMGGTWSFLPHKYQSWFVKNVFDASNGQRHSGRTLKESQTINETADKRVIGLTLETRPDFITERELIRMRKYGCTRIEIGVQTLHDHISKLTKRGHGRAHVFRAMRLMKDFGFKICWHLMPGLPGSNPELDLEMMKETFSNEDCKPDFIKIYPCVVLETAELKEWWEDGRYVPYHDDDIVKLLIKFQTFVPEYVRIMRLMRDIPVSNILDGAKFSNLRQILTDQPKKLREVVGDKFYDEHNLDEVGFRPKDIRTREVGFKDLEKNPDLLKMAPVLTRRDYKASGGEEVFLSFESEDKETLFALLRLRKPSGQKFSQFGSVLHDAALIREVHSYGGEISVGDTEEGLGQHRGLGKRLIAEAERIAREEWGMKKITIIAGVGTREYYKKWGYKLKSTYMTKKLK